jgi:hypothetical protein
MKKLFISSIYLFLSTTFLYAQDTLSGNYQDLTILKGKHIINSMVIVSNSLKVDSGAKVEFVDNGTLVCGGLVEMFGNKYDIEFYGKKNTEGVGLIINNNNEKSVIINNVIFRNLQMPLYFDFGWKRNLVSITHNKFDKNIGKVSLIQVLNAPYGINDSAYVQFDLSDNTFSNNNSSLYFEDLKNDQIHYNITQNVFVNNLIFGSKVYNIANNIIYGRIDQIYKKFLPTIERNSFINNNLVDILTDTIVHLANIGLYGTEKMIIFKNNYFGDNNKYKVYEGIYDQDKNYSLPKIILEPFLNLPLNNIDAHIYKIFNGKNGIEINEAAQPINIISSFILRSNKELDYTNVIIEYINLKNDTTLLETKNRIKYNFTIVDKNNVKIDLLEPSNFIKLGGYFNIQNIINLEYQSVPDIKIGYKSYLVKFFLQKLIIDSINNLKGLENINKIKLANAPKFKKYYEFSVGTGGSMFTGTVSSPSIFTNEVTFNNTLIATYHFSNNLNTSLMVSYFDLGNIDYKSTNLEEVARGFHFTTKVLSLTPAIQLKITESNLSSKKLIYTSFLGLGFDYIKFNPTSSYKGLVYDLQPLGTGGQFIDSSKKPYNLSTYGLMLSYRFDVNFSKKNSISFLLSYHRAFSNYLDDVGSDIYPDPDLLLSKTKLNGPAAVYFSNPTSQFIPFGTLRSSPGIPNDSYFSFNILYTRKLFK